MGLFSDIQKLADIQEQVFTQLSSNYKASAQVARNTMNKLAQTDDAHLRSSIHNECSFIARFSLHAPGNTTFSPADVLSIPKDFQERYPAYCAALAGHKLVKVENFYFPAFMFDDIVQPVKAAQFTRQVIHNVRVRVEQEKINAWSVQHLNRERAVSKQIEALEEELAMLREWEADVTDYAKNWQTHQRYQKKAALLARKSFKVKEERKHVI